MKKKVLACVLLCICMVFSACGKTTSSQITSLEDLNGKRISALMGSTHVTTIMSDERLADAQIIQAQTSSDGLAMLLAKQAEAFVTDYVSAKQIVMQNQGLLILDDTLDEAQYGIAFPKGSRILGGFNDALAEFKADGTLDKLIHKWTETEYPVIEVKSSESRKVVTCLVESNFPPLCYKDSNGELTGLEVELASMAAETQGYHIMFRESAFSDIIPYIESGKADMALSGITATAERAEHVSFTSGYLKADTVLVVRDASYNTEISGKVLSMKNSFHRVFGENGNANEFLDGVYLSIIINIISGICGLLFGALLFLWVYSGSRIANAVTTGLTTFLTYIPCLTWLLFVQYVIFIRLSAAPLFLGIFGLTVEFGLSVFLSLKGNVASIGRGQTDAALALGYSKYKMLLKVYIPEILPGFFSDMDSAVVDLVKCSALVEFVGVMDFQAVSDAVRARSMEPVLPVVVATVFYIILIFAARYLVRYLGQKYSEINRSEAEIRARIERGKF